MNTVSQQRRPRKLLTIQGHPGFWTAAKHGLNTSYMVMYTRHSWQTAPLVSTTAAAYFDGAAKLFDDMYAVEQMSWIEQQLPNKEESVN
jgi:hypothetical protein